MNLTLPLILAIAGCISLLVGAFGGDIKTKDLSIPKVAPLGRLFSTAAGLVLIALSTMLYTNNQVTPPATPSPTAITPTEIVFTPTVEPTATVPVTYTSTPLPAPQIFEFAACLQPCNGANNRTAFPQKTVNIYMTWRYANIPVGAHVISTWVLVEKKGIWAVYDCKWTDPPSGKESFNLYSARGLTSGTWRLTVEVNGDMLLQHEIFLQGKWTNWSPQGVRTTCF